MPTPEEKYYDGMNTLLAPVRYAKSLIQTAIIILLLIGAGLFYPIIQIVRDGHMTFGGFVVSFLTALFIFTLFYTPGYTVVGGIICFVVFYAFCFSQSFVDSLTGTGFSTFIFIFLAVGILQKYIRWNMHYGDGKWELCKSNIRCTKISQCVLCRADFKAPLHSRLGYNWYCPKCDAKMHPVESARKDGLDFDSLDKKKSKERQRERRQAEAPERQRFRAENKEIFTGIRNLLSICATPAVEIMREDGAIEGKELEAEPKHVVWLDVGFILASVRRTGSGIDYIDMLWEEVTRAIRPPDVDGLPSLSVVPKRAVEQLGFVSLLAEYDTQQGTNFTSKAASAYRRIVTAVRDHCGSLAAKRVADKYIELLSPYIYDGGGNKYAGNSTSSAGSHSNRKSVCEKCGQAFGLLDLPLGASNEDVNLKKRAFAELFHDDRLRAMSETARRIAKEQHQSVNEACGHLLTCPVRAKLNSGTIGSEPPPVPKQSPSEKTAGEETEHQPSPASATDGSGLARQEHGQKVSTEQERIDALDATRRKVDETTNEIRDFLEQTKKQKQTTLKRL